jgi:hypothetical protein
MTEQVNGRARERRIMRPEKRELCRVFVCRGKRHLQGEERVATLNLLLIISPSAWNSWNSVKIFITSLRRVDGAVPNPFTQLPFTAHSNPSTLLRRGGKKRRVSRMTYLDLACTDTLSIKLHNHYSFRPLRVRLPEPPTAPKLRYQSWII